MDRKYTTENYNKIHTKCSDHSLNRKEWEENSFSSDGVTSLFFTNIEVNMDNSRLIVKLGKPIVNIESDNSNSEVRRLKLDAFYGLYNSLFLEIGPKLLLETNIPPKQSFSSSYTGVVKEIFYEKGTPPPPKLTTFSGLKLKIALVLPSFLPKTKYAKTGFQFILYKENTSMQEGLDSQIQCFLSGWNVIRPYGRLKGKPLGPTLFCTLEKNNLNMASPMLHFQSHQNLQCWCFWWHGEEPSQNKNITNAKYSQASRGGSVLGKLFQRNHL